MQVKKATEADLAQVLFVEDAAFGRDDVVGLTRDLLQDPTAEPALSLLAWEGDRPVGHILFTPVRLDSGDGQPPMAILAPLAVIPEFQKQDVGGMLIREGLRLLKESGVGLVFVLGHPGYYPRHGFQPAGVQGFTAPYPIPEKDAGAWMVQELAPGLIASLRGKVICAESLDKPEHWRE